MSLEENKRVQLKFKEWLENWPGINELDKAVLYKAFCVGFEYGLIEATKKESPQEENQ